MHVQWHIAARLPWWHRRRGTDHAWLTTADGGGCNLNTLPRLRRSVVMAHYIKARGRDRVRDRVSDHGTLHQDSG